MWARLSLFLLAALASAVAVGAWLGHRLVQDAPFGPGVSGTPAETAPFARIADAAGQTRVPEPPQPRVDGTLGVPVRGAAPGQSVPLVSLLEQENRGIAVSSSRPAPDLGNFIAGLEAPRQSQGAEFAVAPVDAGAAPPQGRPELPPELAFAVARPADDTPPPASRPAWQQSLGDSLGRCSIQRFFTPAECEQRLRIQYCEPNGGWGRVPECPAHLRSAGLR